ncbi:hypothetical protein EXIGLDRAFT_246110 [Exidia glandulosa HHB12029]|uniref:Hemerythrin-like domain-containing protein n=1 Tax=Exidia glandulosa HHB12029 TaxID=1314781 RepID=A0A165QA68_EXIGL|nr:hypothetical protein EXIGLDRAFT_246110 [Exidia glandulosa HHB12029]
MSTSTVPLFHELDTYDKLKFLMVRVHDAFKLGYHNILQHLDTPPLDDLPNFIGYSTAWAQNIVDHHDTEEALLFPFLSKHLNMDGEIEQHKVMHAALDDFIAFLHDPRNVQPDTFDADAMRTKLVALKDPLFTHLDEEVSHIGRENVQVFDRAEVEDICVQLDKYAQAHGNPWTEVPYMLSHIAPPYHGTFPEMPWVVRKLMVPVFAFRYRGYWKYSPYPVA